LPAVPRRAVVVGLVADKLVAEVRVVAPEVDRLASGVDLRLVRGLGLAEHGRCVDRVAPGSGEQSCGAQQHGSALVVRGRGPRLARGERGADRVIDVPGAADRILRDRELVAVWTADVGP